ncbi:MAG: hypothetical protein ACKVT2_20705 [Saprospiraceae bacterium]
MKNLSQLSASWLTTVLIVCLTQTAFAQWTGSATILPTNSNASVGIGTTTPLARLHVKGAGLNLKLESTTTMNLLGFHSGTTVKGIVGTLGNVNDMNFGTFDGNGSGTVNLVIANLPKLTLLPSGFVGIGLTAPATTLHVKSAASDTMPLRIESGSSTINRTEYWLNGARKGYLRVSTDMDFGTSSSGSNKLHFVTGGTRRMTVLPSTGYVGIGITNPQNQFHVKGTGIPFRLESTNPAIRMDFYTPDGVKGYAGIFSSNPATPPNMDFGTLGGTLGNVNLVINSTPCLTVFNNSNVGIGTVISNPYKLSVNGTIRAKEVRVETGWADYVFDENFRLRPLAEVEQFIQVNKHLPDVTSAADIQKDGLQVAKQMTEMMQKVEELTLYVIQLDKENAALRARVGALEAARK